MLDLAEIRARLPQPTPAMPRSSYTLAAEWDVTRQTFGRSRHMLSDAVNGDDVYLMIEVRPGSRVEWHCSPPGYDERDYASGTVLVEQETVDPALDEAKQQAFAAWARWVSEDTGEPVPPELKPEEQDIADLLSEVDRLAPDAQQWVKLRDAIYVASKRMGYELPRGDHDLVILMANALHFAVTAHRSGLVDGLPLAWRKDDAGWGLVVVFPQGISSLGDVMRIDALEEWRWAIHEPFDHGYVGSPEEALGEMRKRLPGWKIPDMPAELLEWDKNHPPVPGQMVPGRRSSPSGVFTKLTWIYDSAGGFVLVADVFGGITVATIATKTQLIPDSAPLRWTVDGRPPKAGDAWSFTEALKAIRRALPSCPVPDLPAGVK